MISKLDEDIEQFIYLYTSQLCTDPSYSNFNGDSYEVQTADRGCG
jgi:hypothetical protein